MESFIYSLAALLKELSYAGIVLALTFEFVPGEIILPLVGYWVYEGEMNLWLACLAGTIGGVTGPLTLYFLGKYLGRSFFVKYGKYIFISEGQLRRAEIFFEKHGSIVAFTARFLPGIRTLISIPCGLTNMNVLLFSIYTFLAMAPITFFYIYLGFRLGPNWSEVAVIADHYMPLAIVGIFLLLLIYLWMKKRVERTNYISIQQFLNLKKK
ncbi:DedA family protein [Bacillus taeanensis]|uniref:DedA family protein n=1 Tax=Bacillus taeanensis TaxID=273032 RepID=A0A366XS95_9BACI|nr:DedA family protein [Bacillus taeanensis]RBW68005.1 DedA family protein [Bacillus taeanensis]